MNTEMIVHHMKKILFSNIAESTIDKPITWMTLKITAELEMPESKCTFITSCT